MNGAIYDKEDDVWWGYEEKNENFKYCAGCVADAVFWYEFDEDSDNIDFREIEGFSVHSLDRIDID